MIITGYQGIGKSTLAGSSDKIIDLESGCFWKHNKLEGITLKQLLKQCDKIKPYWCACGIKSLDEDETNWEPKIIIDYDSIEKAGESVTCQIVECL